MKLLLLLLPALAGADVRVEGHVAAGMEGGVITGAGRPDGVSEYGGGITWFRGAKGFGVVVERVGRLTRDLPTASETKLDAMFALRSSSRRFTAGFGAGLRKLEIEAEPDGRASTLWGVDLVRMQGMGRLVRVGPVELDIYFAWTFALVGGEVYGRRYGDMAYPVRDYWTVASSYVVGLATAFDTQP